MVFPKPRGLILDLWLRFYGQAPQGRIGFGLGPLGLAVSGGVAPRPGSPGLGQFPRFAPDTAAT
jgi:hypothetical protein